MAANIRPFTINDFPSEIIERFAPDLRPRTVSTLRLVSARFRDVFTADRFYSAYLCYADRPTLYRRDLEVAGDEEGRWRRCLAAEKRRLDNWRQGRPTRVETVEFPEDVRDYINVQSFKCVIDEHDEHWMSVECYNRKIILFNTADAPISTVHDISDVTREFDDFSDLGHGQVFIKGKRGVTEIFNIKKQTNEITMRHHFNIPDCRHRKHLIISGRSQTGLYHTNLFIRFKPVASNGILQLWDTKRAVRLQNVCLAGFRPLAGVFTRPCPVLTMWKGEFPNVLVGTGRSSVVMVNVETKQLTHSFGGTESHMLAGCIADCDTTCLVTVAGNICVRLSVYKNGQQTPQGRHAAPQPIFRFDQDFCPGTISVVGKISFADTTVIIYVEQHNKVYVVNIDDSGVTRKEISLTVPLVLFSVTFIGPFFIVKSVHDCSFFTPRTYDMSGIELFRRENIIWERHINGRNCRLIDAEGVEYHSLFQCVMVDQNNALHVCHF